jgi:hypothetical protein
MVRKRPTFCEESVFWIGPNVGNMNGFAFKQSPANDCSSPNHERMFFHELHEFRRVAVTRCILKNFAVRLKGASQMGAMTVPRKNVLHPLSRRTGRGNLVVQLGLATEELNRCRYEANTGQVITDLKKQVEHPALRYGGNLGRAGSGQRRRPIALAASNICRNPPRLVATEQLSCRPALQSVCGGLSSHLRCGLKACNS